MEVREAMASAPARLTTIAQDGPAAAATPASAATMAPEPYFTAAGPYLWGGFAGAMLVFALVMIVLMRWRVAGKRAKPRRQTKTDFFEPAGADAEIDFDDRPDAVRDTGRKGGAAPQRREAASAPTVAPEIAPDAPEAPQPAKRGAFAGLFGRRKAAAAAEGDMFAEVESEPAATLKSHPLANERRRPREQDAGERAPEGDERRRVLAEAEEARLLSEKLAEQRRAETAARASAEEIRRRTLDDARAGAEREAEFERRKLAAALEQRERETARRIEAASIDSANLRRELLDEIDRRVGGGGDSQPRQAALTAPALNTPVTAPQSPANDSGDSLRSVLDLVGRRLAEHREAINASLASLSNRLDSLAGAPHDVAALRRDIAGLRQMIGDRAAAATAPQVQLADIVRNALAPDAYELNAVLANRRKADCLVKLPIPPGPIAVDARFPVEAFAPLSATGEEERARAETEFRRTALRHVVDIAERLIVPGSTAESALMFLPSESMYAELHARFPDIVQDCYRARVWPVSPTTLMATLHTVQAIMREAQDKASIAPAAARPAPPEPAQDVPQATAPVAPFVLREVTAAEGEPADYAEIADAFDGDADAAEVDLGEEEDSAEQVAARPPFPLR